MCARTRVRRGASCSCGSHWMQLAKETMAAVTKKALKVAEMRICMMICPSTVISPWCGIEEIGSHRGAFYQAMCMIGGLSRLEVGSYVCTTCEVLQAGGLMVPWWGSQARR